jgi:tetratricopeptide (TPR) repeat protein
MLGYYGLVLIFSLFALPVQGFAEAQTITATGTYRVGTHDARADAQRLALLDAKRLALEQAIASLGNVPAVKQLGLDQESLKAYLVALLDFQEQPLPVEENRAGPDVSARITATIDPVALERRLQVLLQNERAKAELTRVRDKIEGYRKEVEADSTQLASLSDPSEVNKVTQHRRDALDLIETEAQLLRTWGLLLGAQGPRRPPPPSQRNTGSHEPSRSPQVQAGGSDNAEEHRKKGVSLNKDGQYDAAAAEFRLALQLVPSLPHAHLGLGVALQGKGDLDGAIAEYRTELQARPEDGDAHNNLATVLQSKGDLEHAIAEYRTALRLKPDDALMHFDLGTALAAKDQVEESIAEYQTAIRLRPDFAEAYFDLGSLLKTKGQTAEAADALQSYLKLAPDTPANKQWIEQAKRMLQEIGEKPRRHRRQ